MSHWVVHHHVSDVLWSSPIGLKEELVDEVILCLKNVFWKNFAVRSDMLSQSEQDHTDAPVVRVYATNFLLSTRDLVFFVCLFLNQVVFYVIPMTLLKCSVICHFMTSSSCFVDNTRCSPTSGTWSRCDFHALSRSMQRQKCTKYASCCVWLCVSLY